MPPKVHITRRELVASAAAGAAVAAVPPVWARELLSRRARVGPGRFEDGVASGDPSATAVTFWSRLETDRPRSGARLVVARDPGMRKVEATAIVPTGRGVNGTLKTRIGGLRPSREYFYVWESGNGISEVGRTRTAPARDSAENLQIGFSSCQQYAVGYFGAHAHAAGALPNLDLYLFLGDYVYEDGSPSNGSLRADGINAVDLRTYRRKYALYRSDPGLRELHRVHPTAHIWDDHEVENNYSDNSPPPAAAQRQAGYRAAFEWLPRMSPRRERNRIYKRLRLGQMADVFLLDERQYRTGDLDGQPRRLLGERQMNWLIRGLKASTATWKIIAQQVVVATIFFGRNERTNDDAWDGYAEDRARLLGEIERAGISNVVFLTGDAHVFMANLLGSDFASLGDGSTRRPAATEYVGGSVTSPGRVADERNIQEDAPWNKQYNGSAHGYATLDLAADRLVTDYLAGDLTNPSAGAVPFERFVQPVGSNAIERQAPPQPPPPPPPT